MGTSKEQAKKKSFNVNLKGKHQTGRLRSRWEQQVMKEVTYVEGGLWVQRQTERLGYQTTHIN
jgi:hypothetical protein